MKPGCFPVNCLWFLSAANQERREKAHGKKKHFQHVYLSAGGGGRGLQEVRRRARGKWKSNNGDVLIFQHHCTSSCLCGTVGVIVLCK